MDSFPRSHYVDVNRNVKIHIPIVLMLLRASNTDNSFHFAQFPAVWCKIVSTALDAKPRKATDEQM